MIKIVSLSLVLVMAVGGTSGECSSQKPKQPAPHSKFNGRPCYKEGQLAKDKYGLYICDRQGHKLRWKKTKVYRIVPDSPEPV